MILKIYSIYDKVTGQFANPFYQLNDGSAERFFINLSNYGDNKTVSADWQLYYLGTFNVDTGDINSVKPEFVRGAVENE